MHDNMKAGEEKPFTTVAEGISYCEANGRYPSAQLIWSLVRGNSQRVNDERRAILRGRKETAPKPSDIPEAARVAFENGLRILNSAVLEAAQERVTTIEQRCDARVAEADRDTDDALKAQEAIEQERDTLKQALGKALERVAELEVEQAKLEARLEEKETQNADLKDILKAVRPTRSTSQKGGQP